MGKYLVAQIFSHNFVLLFATKKQEKMIQIRNWRTSEVIFEGDYQSIKDAVEAAVKQRVSLAWADLAGADLTDASLIRADLRGASLIGANLEGVNLTGANLTGAKLKWADLTDAIVTGTILEKKN